MPHGMRSHLACYFGELLWVEVGRLQLNGCARRLSQVSNTRGILCERKAFDTCQSLFFSFPFFGLKDPCSTLAIGRESQRLLKTRKLYFNDDNI